MNTPRFLVGAALLFWGWQSGFVVPAVLMAILLEGARWVKVRWELSEEDFSRIWTFCCLVLLGTMVYAFTSNEGPADLRGFLQNPTPWTTRNAGVASARTAAAVVRWLPMIFFLFLAAQSFSTRESVPVEIITLILQIRWKKKPPAPGVPNLGALAPSSPLAAGRDVNVCYPYFALCIFAASIHMSEDTTYFWGVSALAAWALWSQRSARFSIGVWICALLLAVGLGFGGQLGLNQFQGWLANYNPQWFSHPIGGRADPARSKTAIGNIGRLKMSGTIVVRLEPKTGSAPALLREASYRAYRTQTQTWYSETSSNDFENLAEEAHHGNWVLLPGKSNSFRVNIASYLGGGYALLPLPAGSGRLEDLPAYVLHKNSLGAVLAEGPGLVIFDALYGPGGTLDSAPNSVTDLAVPPNEAPFLDKVLADLQLSTNQEPQTVVRKLAAFFQNKFNYSMWQPSAEVPAHRFRRKGSGSSNWLMDTNRTPLSKFLLETRSGHCEYFATATVLLLRQLQIPARYAIGYAVHEHSGNRYVVRQRDAHAWSLVWDAKGQIWRDFDTTPGSWVETEATRASPLQTLSDIWSWIWFEVSKIRWGQTHLRQYLLWALAPILALLLYRIIFRNRRRMDRGKLGAGDLCFDWPGLDSEFYQLEGKLALRGLARPPNQPLSEWLLRTAAEPGWAEIRETLNELLRLHYRYRFDPAGLEPSEREALRRQSQICLNRIATQT